VTHWRSENQEIDERAEGGITIICRPEPVRRADGSKTLNELGVDRELLVRTQKLGGARR